MAEMSSLMIQLACELACIPARGKACLTDRSDERIPAVCKHKLIDARVCIVYGTVYYDIFLKK